MRWQEKEQEEKKIILDRIRHEDKLRDQRLNWLLLFHGFLFGTLGTVWSQLFGVFETLMGKTFQANRIFLSQCPRWSNMLNLAIAPLKLQLLHRLTFPLLPHPVSSFRRHRKHIFPYRTRLSSFWVTLPCSWRRLSS